jgi:uncharacterized iron-regulated membrane protein
MIPFEESLSKNVNDAAVLALTRGKSPVEDRLWLMARVARPGFKGSIDVHPPHDKHSSVEISVNPDPDTYWKADYLFYDQYTLEEIEVKHLYGKLANTTAADKLARMNYDIHVGAVLGLPGKIMAFLASLVAASLPITGFLIWRGRKKKKATL